MADTQNATKLSEMAENWLKKHNLHKKAVNVTEKDGKLEFHLPSRTPGFRQLNEVRLPNGSWSTTEYRR
jgi:DNA modification methylase